MTKSNDIYSRKSITYNIVVDLSFKPMRPSHSFDNPSWKIAVKFFSTNMFVWHIPYFYEWLLSCYKRQVCYDYLTVKVTILLFRCFIWYNILVPLTLQMSFEHFFILFTINRRLYKSWLSNLEIHWLVRMLLELFLFSYHLQYKEGTI